MELWQELLTSGTSSYDDLRNMGLYFGPDLDTCVYVNAYLLDIIKKQGVDSPIGKQFIPSIQENHVSPMEMVDSLCEDTYSHGSLVHKYPDRALLYFTGACAGLCRFCTRKRRVLSSSHEFESSQKLEEAISYLKKHPEIDDLLLSGGDPLLCSDEQLENLFGKLNNIGHLKTIRIGTRTISVLPQRITENLCRIFTKYDIKYINTHFNHPSEITDEATQAVKRLRLAGVNVGCQTVLLKGVNDDEYVMRTLMKSLYAIGIKPYYIYHADLVVGISHFRASISDGVKIMRSMQGWISGMAVPKYVFDSPIGKVPVSPDYIKEISKGVYDIIDYKGKTFRYVEELVDN